jgi:hypothetical protein
MGANKTYQQRSDNRVIVGDSHEFKRLCHAIGKAHGDRERAITFVCRLARPHARCVAEHSALLVVRPGHPYILL